MAATCQKTRSLTHGSDVGGAIGGVGYDQQACRGCGYPAMNEFIDIGCQTFSRDPPPMRADSIGIPIIKGMVTRNVPISVNRN